MNTFRRLLPAFLIFVFSCFVHADNFKSLTIAGGSQSGPIRVHGDQFMLIRNFTQEDGITRGVVMVTTPPNGGTTLNVLAAAILSTATFPPPDVINSIVIAGPADVVVTCGASIGKNCFISYKKDSN